MTDLDPDSWLASVTRVETTSGTGFQQRVLTDDCRDRQFGANVLDYTTSAGDVHRAREAMEAIGLRDEGLPVDHRVSSHVEARNEAHYRGINVLRAYDLVVTVRTADGDRVKLTARGRERLVRYYDSCEVILRAANPVPEAVVARPGLAHRLARR